MDMCGIEDLMANSVLVQAKKNSATCEKWRKNFKLPDPSVFEEVKKKIKIELEEITPEECKKDEKKLEHFHFNQLCDKQPIGKQMFTDFCKTAEKKIKDVFSLTQAIRNYEISIESEKLDCAKTAVNSHLVPKAPFEVFCLTEELKSACATIVTSDPAPGFDEIKEILESSKAVSIDVASDGEARNNTLTILGTCNQPDVILAHSSDDERRQHIIKLLFDHCKHHTTNFFVDEVFSKYKKSKEYETFLRWKYKEKEEVVEEDFMSLRILGRGGFGEVFAYQVKCTGKLYACKKTCKKKMKQKHAEKIVHMEKITLQGSNSPFVVNLAYAYENKNYLNLVMTLMGSGDLKFHIYEASGDDKQRGLSPEKTKFYTAQITLGMDHLHSEDILYRDLKPENVLLDDQGNVRIADLGLVCVLTGNQKTSGRAGTIGFMAPEMLSNEEYAFGVDWFALGCTLYEMVEGRGPFLAKEKKKISIDGTVKKTIEEKHSYKRSHPGPLIDILDQLLEKKVSNRLAGDERRKRGMKKARRQGYLYREVDCDWRKRGERDWRRPCTNESLAASAEAIKRHPYFSDVNWDRLEAGLIPPPFVPDPNQIYAKDVSDIKPLSEAKGVTLNDEDKKFHDKFASGRVPITWQHEVIETGLFDEIMQGKYDNPKSGNSGKKSKVCMVL